MRKETFEVLKALKKCANECVDIELQGYISVFSENLIPTILISFEELTSYEIIDEYEFSTGLEWKCSLKINLKEIDIEQYKDFEEMH